MTSKWTNAMKSTNKTKLRSKKLISILRQITIAAGKKNLDPDQFNVAVLKAKYNELVEMKGKPASDWVVKLSEECYILYYCMGCNIAPTSANQWYRCCTKPQLLNIRGNSGTKGH